MSLNFGVTQGSGADSQPNAPADMVSLHEHLNSVHLITTCLQVSNMTQSQMKNFLTLKNKIIRTE